MYKVLVTLQRSTLVGLLVGLGSCVPIAFWIQWDLVGSETALACRRVQVGHESIANGTQRKA